MGFSSVKNGLGNTDKNDFFTARKKNTASFQLFNMSFYPFELEQQSLCCSLLCILICSPIRKTWEFQCSKFYWVLSGNQARPWGGKMQIFYLLTPPNLCIYFMLIGCLIIGLSKSNQKSFQSKVKSSNHIKLNLLLS